AATKQSAALYPETAANLAACSAQVAVDHSGRCIGEGNKAELSRPGQQPVIRQYPDRVAERPGLAELLRSDVSGHPVGPRTPIELERRAVAVEDLFRAPGRAVSHLDTDIVGRQCAQCPAGPHGHPTARAQLTVVGRLDVLDPHPGPAAGHPVLPGGELASSA